MRKIFRPSKFKYHPTKRYRINEEIRAPQVRLINEESLQQGIVSRQEALELAREKEMDLVEVSPQAQPPVVKILDHGKFKYIQEKKIQKQKARQKKTELKGIRLSLRISSHDLELRQQQAKKFLEKGDKLKIEMILRGREHKHTGRGREIINQFIAGLQEKFLLEIEQPLTKQAGRLSVIVFPKKQ